MTEIGVLCKKIKFSLEVEMHYSADNNCDSLSGPGWKMGLG